jgi:hypothetical protein
VVGSGLGVGKGPNFGTAPSPQQYVRLYSDIHRRVQFGTMLSTPPDIPHVDDPDHLLFRFGVSDESDARVGAKPMVNQFIFLPRPTPDPTVSYEDSYRRGEELTINGGESGSFIINSNNEIIAMLVARIDPSKVGALPMDKMELADVKYFGIASPIAPILANLKVTIPPANDGWSGVVPAAGTGRFVTAGAGGDAVAVTRRRNLVRLTEELRGSVRGQLLLGKIGQHRREVRRLLTTVRPIVAAWRALGGAAFHHHCVRSIERSGHRIPTNINGVSRERLVTAMLPLFAEYGSDGLRRDIEHYRVLFADALIHIESIMDAPWALARRRDL